MTESSSSSKDRGEVFKRHRLALLSTLVLAMIIAWGMLHPKPPTPDLDIQRADKLYHVIAFAGLIFPTAMLFARSLIWILPLAAFFGGVIELVQPCVGRDAELADVLADLLGLGVGTVFGLTLRAWRRRWA